MAGQQKELIAARETMVILYVGLSRLRDALKGRSTEDPFDVLTDIEATFPFHEWDRLDQALALEKNLEDDGR